MVREVPEVEWATGLPVHARPAPSRQDGAGGDLAHQTAEPGRGQLWAAEELRLRRVGPRSAALQGVADTGRGEA